MVGLIILAVLAVLAILLLGSYLLRDKPKDWSDDDVDVLVKGMWEEYCKDYEKNPPEELR